MFPNRVLILLTLQPSRTCTVSLDVLECRAELGQVYGFETVPVLDAVADGDEGVGVVEVVEVEDGEGVGRENVAEEPGECGFAGGGGAGYADEEGG